MYNVERQGLDAVEHLIQQREVDVVVVLNWERLARKIERRHAALYLAHRYGVEYRFAELVPEGKLPDTLEARIAAPILEAYGEINREKRVSDTKRGRLKLAAQGLPAGGRGGPPYGFRYAHWTGRHSCANCSPCEK